jgi:hypothetical protein
MTTQQAKSKTAKTIQCYEKEVYGNVHIYCFDPLIAIDLSVLTGKKTISRSDINALRSLGLTVELVELPTRSK